MRAREQDAPVVDAVGIVERSCRDPLLAHRCTSRVASLARGVETSAMLDWPATSGGGASRRSADSVPQVRASHKPRLLVAPVPFQPLIAAATVSAPKPAMT